MNRVQLAFRKIFCSYVHDVVFVMPIALLDSSVTCVGSDDDRTVESFRAENDALRDTINNTEKNNLESETRTKILADEVAELKLKIKKLMESKAEDISAIVSLDEITEIRAFLKSSDVKPSKRTQPTESTHPEQTKDTHHNSARKKSVMDPGQQVRDALRSAKTAEEITHAIEKAKKLGLKHEQELGQKLLESRAQY